MADVGENPDSVAAADDQLGGTYRYHARFQPCVRSFASPETLWALEYSGGDHAELVVTLLESRHERFSVARRCRMDEEFT